MVRCRNTLRLCNLISRCNHCLALSEKCCISNPSPLKKNGFTHGEYCKKEQTITFHVTSRKKKTKLLKKNFPCFLLEFILVNLPFLCLGNHPRVNNFLLKKFDLLPSDVSHVDRVDAVSRRRFLAVSDCLHRVQHHSQFYIGTQSYLWTNTYNSQSQTIPN